MASTFAEAMGSEAFSSMPGYAVHEMTELKMVVIH